MIVDAYVDFLSFVYVLIDVTNDTCLVSYVVFTLHLRILYLIQFYILIYIRSLYSQF